MKYNFEWDPKKAKANKGKHKVGFEDAATVFKDPKAISIFDTEHSDEQDRWISIGLAPNGSLLVVHHTFNQINNKNVVIRIISCRKATKNETNQYKEL